MMNSLLSVFDPSSFLMLNWMTWVVLLFPIRSYWMISPLKSLNNSFKELMYMLFDKSENSLIFISLFWIILVMNILGLYPYVFSMTSHFIFNLSLSLPLWLACMMMGLWKNLDHIMAHLTPEGCPPILIPFMVLVEMISSLIRPFTLALRLMSNMLAGHLVLALISLGMTKFTGIMFGLLMFIHTGMLMFELGVAFIQAYIFTYLMLLYWEEIK
uniref:ATP synthase F0 subunit 6 n=1 Tax=Menacanthus cornutus TaxID=1491751 RepID=UPI002001566C|nr:ATP synthase F0 subunit 6 [Menacanthus cornutus]UNZ12995.1 ATP synthase F0 subunit 6 [Menacanthus cornutus]